MVTPAQIMNWLTPWSTVLLEKPGVTQLMNKFLAFYGTKRFIIAFTKAHHLASILSLMDPTDIIQTLIL
jgi:hypothetical protein